MSFCFVNKPLRNFCITVHFLKWNTFSSNRVLYSTISGKRIDFEHESQEETFRDKLYPEHIPTSQLQKVLLTLGSSFCSITDPYRHDMIAVLSETTGYGSAKHITEKMMDDPEGSVILQEKPRINSNTLDYKYLESLPDGTFGRAYITFLKNNNVTPDSRRPVRYVDDLDIAYVIQRYREVHDLLHTLLGMPTHMLGEVAVKWVEATQTHIPMCTAAAVFGPIRLRKKQRHKYLKTYLPWAVKCGQQSKFLLNIYYENRWHQDLCELQKELNIPKFPGEP